MKTFLAIFLLCCAASAFAQKIDADLPHATTTLGTAQCLADARLWRTAKSVDSATYGTLLGESDEMVNCLDLQSTPAEHFTYAFTAATFATAERDRLWSFIQRNGNPLEFANEDATDKR